MAGARLLGRSPALSAVQRWAGTLRIVTEKFGKVRCGLDDLPVLTLRFSVPRLLRRVDFLATPEANSACRSIPAFRSSRPSKELK